MAVISYVTCDRCNRDGSVGAGFVGWLEGSVSEALDDGWLWRVEDSKTKHICPECRKKERGRDE